MVQPLKALVHDEHEMIATRDAFDLALQTARARLEEARGRGLTDVAEKALREAVARTQERKDAWLTHLREWQEGTWVLPEE